MKNKYVYRSRISEAKFRQILKLFCIDIEANKISLIVGVSRPTINKLLDKIRERIAEYCDTYSPLGIGEFEFDESYFGAKRVRGKRGRGAKGKIPVFGMFKRGDKVYTKIIKGCSINEIMPIVLSQIDKEAIIYTDGLKVYEALANFGYNKHYRIKHSSNEFAKGNTHINGIENFWGLCKVRLSRYRGIHKHKFYFHLKECEFRYNNRGQNLYLLLCKIIRETPLKLS